METKAMKNRIQIFLLLLPGILMFSVFTIYPIVKLFVMSFFSWDLSSMHRQEFIGFQNYAAVLSDEVFLISLVNTLLYTMITVPAQMALGLLVAVLIHSLPRYQISFRVIHYLPVITPWVIASLVFKYIFNTEGMLNYFLHELLHLTNRNIAWLDSRWSGMFVIETLGIWKGVGWNMVIFLAALQGVPEELYEVADLDGCGSIRKFFYVTLPSIKNTILFAMVMLTIGGFNVFTSIKLITDGKPLHQTQTVLTWMYYKAFRNGEFGYTAALSFIVVVALIFLATLQFRIMKNRNEED